MAKEKCEYGGGCAYCLYVDTCAHPAKEALGEVLYNYKDRLRIDPDIVRERIIALELTQTGVSRMLGEDEKLLTKAIARGVHLPIEDIKRLAEILNLPYDSIVSSEQVIEVEEYDPNPLRERVEELGGNRAEICRTYQIHYTTLSELLKARHMPTQETLDTVCGALGIDTSEVYKLQEGWSVGG